MRGSRATNVLLAMIVVLLAVLVIGLVPGPFLVCGRVQTPFGPGNYECRASWVPDFDGSN